MSEKYSIRTQDVLKIFAAGAFIIASGIVPSLPVAVSSVYKAWKKVNQKDLGRIIKRLEKQEMIAIKESQGRTVIEITEKGKRRLVKYDFENLEIKRKKRDGAWRLIIFDIPEYKKKNRDAFRRKLVELDCLRLQDSVFVSAYPCKDEIDFLCHYFEISDYVTLAVLRKIERGDQLIFKKHIEWLQQ